MRKTDTQSLNLEQGKDTKKDNLKELITNEIVKLSENFEHTEKTTDDILQELSKSIDKIDFQILAFPDIETVKKQIEDLKKFVYNEDGSFNKENKTEFDKYKKLNKRLNTYKLSKNHYLVLCVEQLLKIAKVNNWGLCKKNGFIYLYNGSYWSEINKESFQSFLGSVSLKMGVEKFKCKIHTFKDELFKQFMADAYLPTPKANRKNVLIKSAVF